MSELFVGRHRELAHLKDAADQVLHAGARVITVAGDPGIGKTRTVEELADYAGVRGYQVIWGRCHEGEAMPAYWPWVQVLRSAMRGRESTWVGAHASDLVPYFGHAVPELRQLISEEPSPSMLAHESNRFYLFDSITAFIISLAQAQPLVLILDDLHWADASSLLMLEYLAIELGSERVMVIGTYRDPVMAQQRALLRTLGELPRTRGFTPLRLGRLENEDIRHYLHAKLGFDPSPDIVKAMSQRCEGNPFVMTEMARLLHREAANWDGQTPGEAPYGDAYRWDVMLPEGVEAAIRSRRASLSGSCNRILDVAAVVGREFDAALLELLISDLTNDQLHASLNEARSAWLIAELAGVAGRYQFVHVLTQDCVYNALPPDRRLALHLAIGEALEATYGSNGEQHAAEVAYHFERAGREGGGNCAGHYLLIAGEQALKVYAYEEAESYFRRALQRTSGDTADHLIAQALFGVGRAEGALGKVLDAWRSIGQAVQLFISVGDVGAAVKAAQYPLFYVPGVPAPTQLVSEALRLVPARSRDAGRLLCRYGLLVNLERADDRSAQEALDTAIAIAREHRDVELEMQALTNAADIAWYHLRPADALANSTRAIELARLTDSLHAEAWPRFLAASTAWFTADFTRFTHHTLRMFETAQRLRNHGYLGHAFLLRAMMAYAAGDLEMASSWVRQGKDIAPDFFWLVTLGALIDCEAGEVQQAEDGIAHLLDLMRRTPPGSCGEYVAPAIVIPMATRIIGRSPAPEIVTSCVDAVLSSPAVTPRVATDARTGLALLAVEQKRADQCARLFEQLKPTEGTFSPMLLSMDRVLGLLAATTGDVEGAERHLESAISRCRAVGYLPETAWSCFDYAAWLLDSHARRDTQRAFPFLEEALLIARRSGMRPLAERVARLLARIDVPESHSAGSPDGLTPREIEVLQLVAAGFSNRDIAERLYISIHTVGHHVSSILAKTGAANRSGAASYAARHNLV